MSSASLPTAVSPAPAAAHPLIRWVCTSNPFYVISAGLFLLGLRLSFGTQTRDIDTWALMIGLAGYTLLLAAAALLLVEWSGTAEEVRERLAAAAEIGRRVGAQHVEDRPHRVMVLGLPGHGGVEDPRLLLVRGEVLPEGLPVHLLEDRLPGAHGVGKP